MYPLKTNRDMRELERQFEVRNLPKTMLPATVERAVWEKATKGRAGIMEDSVVEKVWTDIIRGNEEDIIFAEKFGGYKTKAEQRIERRERPALRNKVRNYT